MSHATPPVGFRFNAKFYDVNTNHPFTPLEGPDASFQSVSGISVAFDSETVPDGANTRFSQKLPTKPVYPNLVLKRGFLIDSKIFNWLNAALTNAEVKIQPLDVEINLVNEAGEVLMSVRFIKTWPQKWALTDFDAMTSGLVMETIELTYQYFRIIKV